MIIMTSDWHPVFHWTDCGSTLNGRVNTCLINVVSEGLQRLGCISAEDQPRFAAGLLEELRPDPRDRSLVSPVDAEGRLVDGLAWRLDVLNVCLLVMYRPTPNHPASVRLTRDPVHDAPCALTNIKTLVILLDGYHYVLDADCGRTVMAADVRARLAQERLDEQMARDLVRQMEAVNQQTRADARLARAFAVQV